MKNILLLITFLVTHLVFSQTEIKTNNRPDGVTIKYFTPTPVAIASSHEVGLSLYKNMTTKQYFLVVVVLFKKESPKQLTGNLLLQSTGTKGLSLKPVFHKIINMNGQNAASSMYLLTNRDVNELKINNLKLISFNAYNQPVGLTLTKNKDLVAKQLSKLLKL